MMHVCLRCERLFSRRGNAVKLYCSWACYAAARSEGSRMDPRYLGRARAVRKYRDARPCEGCGVTRRPELKGSTALIQRHHRDGDQLNNAPSNIAFLCFRCHHDAHAEMRAAGIGRKWGGPRPRIVALMRDRAIERARKAAGYLSDGLTEPQIAEVMGVDRGSVRRWIVKYPEVFR